MQLFDEQFLTPEAEKSHRIIGQVFDTYWLIQYGENLYIIDQHAAHEKVLYERTLKSLEQKEMTSQMVSPPLILTLTMQEAQWLEEYLGEIEVIICNNDEMALGAIDALTRSGDSRPVKVVGIDGTPQGIEGLESGKLFGTVLCDSEEYADVIFEIAAAEALGQNVQEKVKLQEGKYYECRQKALTAASLP